MTAPGPHLVLGTALGYGVDRVWIFVESLRRVYDGEVCLLVSSQTGRGTIAYLSARRIRTAYFDAARWIPTHVQTSRYIRYGEILRESPTRFGQVFLTDVADVVFQRDPFILDAPAEIFFFLEDSRATIGTCASNTQWVRDMFGDEVLATLKDSRISCSGTTMGTHEGIIRYIDLMLSHAPLERVSAFGGFKGHDQGIHNFLLHFGKVPGARTVENGVVVYHLGHVPQGDVVIGDNRIMLRQFGYVSPVVHQYNYHPPVDAFIRSLYPIRG